LVDQRLSLNGAGDFAKTHGRNVGLDAMPAFPPATRFYSERPRLDFRAPAPSTASTARRVATIHCPIGKPVGDLAIGGEAPQPMEKFRSFMKSPRKT
jgi:hypothetical protein